MRAVIPLVLAAIAAEAATISGTVYLRQAESRTPLARVRVRARAADGSALLATASSNAQGRYVLNGLPRTRISLSAGKAGDVARAVNGSPNLIFDLRADETAQGADFEVMPGGVVTGRVTDPMGDPLEGVQVGLWRITHFGGRHRSASSAAATDDRGIYRVFGLEPGRYILLARPTHRLGEQRAVALYYPGRSDEREAEEIQVAAGAEIIGIDLTLGAEPSYRIAGKILDVEPEQLGHVYVQAVSGEPGGISSFSMVDTEGNFALTGLPAGTYILTASQRTGIARGDKIFARHKIELRGNLLNLAVRPGRQGSLSGRVYLPPATPARPQPEQVRLRLTDRGGIQSFEATARAPEYTFEFSSLWPGAYSIQPASPAGAYWRKDPEITITEGESDSVELEMAFDLGRVSGVAKAPTHGGGPLPHARVALARLGGSPVEFRTVQADQRGRWTLPEVRPGEYRICAWPSVDVDWLYAPETWEKAGRAVKRFAVEPGAEVYIELTAAPR